MFFPLMTALEIIVIYDKFYDTYYDIYYDTF